MQHAHQPGLQIAQAAPVIVEVAVMAAIQAKGDGVDGEVAAVQIELDAAAFDGGQGGWVIIELLTGADQIQASRQLGGVKHELIG